MRLYIIRHAEPDYPNNTITPAGHLEAKALGERLRGEGLTHLFASPLGRAVDTMGYTAKVTGFGHEVLDWTQEIDVRIDIPGFQGSVWNIHPEILKPILAAEPDIRKLPDVFEIPALKEILTRIARESDAFFSRFGYVREGNLYRIAKPNRFRLAFFCHGGFGLHLLSHLLDIPLSLVYTNFVLPTSSVTTVIFDERSHRYAAPRLLGVGDLSHLHAAGLPMSPMGIVGNLD